MTRPASGDRGPAPAETGERAVPSRRRAWARWALAGILLLGVAVFFASGLHRRFSLEAVQAGVETWRAQVAGNLPAALVVLFLAYTVVTAFSLPIAWVMTVAAGALFGRWLATAVVSLAATAGATLAFLSSRYVLRGWVQERFAKPLERINRGVERDGAYYLFSLRLVPVFPFFLINLAMGLTSIRVRTFAWVSWVGMLPGTFLYANAGEAVAAIRSPGDIVSAEVLLALALLGVAPLAFRLLLRGRGKAPAAAAGEDHRETDRPEL